MKSVLTALALLLAANVAPAATLSFPDTDTAKQQAKEQKKPSVILWHWTKDIGKDGDTTTAVWQQLSTAGELPVVFGQFDESAGDPDKRQSPLPIEQFNLPVAVVLAPDGTFVACLSREETMDAAKATAAVRQALNRLPKFMPLCEKALGTQGVESAKAAGQALDTLRLEDALRHPDLRRIINDRDPKDETGYRALYGLEHMGMYGEINKILQGGPDGKKKDAERDFDAADAYVAKALSNKKLTGVRRQQWLAGKAYILREKLNSQPGDYESKDYAPLVKIYREIVKVDPKSEYAVGAKQYADYWDKNASFTIRDGFYDQRFQCKHNKDWHVDMSKDMQGAKAGTYVFRMVPHNDSGMISRHFRLMVNGKEVAKAATEPNANTKTVEFTVPDIPAKAKVEVWITTRCTDGWMGPSGAFEMEKK